MIPECQGERRLKMKAFLIVLVVSVLFAGVVASASAQDVLDLSTLGKKQTTASVSASALGGNVDTEVLDLSTLGKKALLPDVNTTMIKGATPVTITPMFAIKNMNITTEANTVFSLPQTVAANPGVYTLPIAIYGGA